LAGREVVSSGWSGEPSSGDVLIMTERVIEIRVRPNYKVNESGKGRAREWTQSPELLPV